VLATATQWREEWQLLSTGPRRLEATVLVACLLFVGYFSLGPGYDILRAKLQFATTPLAIAMIFMLWGAVRFGIPGGLLAIGLVMAHAFFYTAAGIGPFAAQYDDIKMALLHVQVSFAIAATLGLFIAARTHEWRHALAESQVSRKRLEFAIEASDMLVFESSTGSGTSPGRGCAFRSRHRAGRDRLCHRVAPAHPSGRPLAHRPPARRARFRPAARAHGRLPTAPRRRQIRDGGGGRVCGSGEGRAWQGTLACA
jgi:hypothetical protein